MLKNNSIFEGFAFVEYDTEEEAKKAIEAKPMLEGKIVEIEAKKELKKKDKKSKEKKEVKKELETYIRFTGMPKDSVFATVKETFKIHGNPWLIYDEGNDNGFLKFSNLEEAQEYHKRITEGAQEFGGVKLEYELLEHGKINDYIKPEVITYVKFTGLDPESNFSDINNLLKLHGKPWVIYENKQDHGYLKFKVEGAAEEYIQKITEAKQQFNGKELEYAILTDEKEIQKLDNKEKKSMKHKGKGKGRKGGKRRNNKK